MHIADIIALRPVPASGLFLSLTRRCPLTCAHCSTNSMLASEEHAASIFETFAATLTPESRPEVILLTGGEPLLRPGLVRTIADIAHGIGSKVGMITGMFFARRSATVAEPLWKALLAVDHVVASQDIYHESQVPRRNVFAVMAALRAAGQDVSFQIVGDGPDDPYLDDITADVRAGFDNQVPALVAQLGSAGRATEWLDPIEIRPRTAAAPAPCLMAGWPVVGYDGTITACCHQSVVDGPAPDHLRLGHSTSMTWAEVTRRHRAPLLRVIQTMGPEFVAQQAGRSPRGYCDTCALLPTDDAVAATVQQLVDSPGFAFTETAVRNLQVQAGPEAFARRYGIAAYADMVTLGYRSEEPLCAG